MSNINISHCNFIRNDSPTNAGGIGLYIKDTLKYKIRNDLSLIQCEDLWIEFQSRKQSIILLTIYRYPNSDLLPFQDKYEKTLIKLNNTKADYIINGDINVNLLKSNCAKVMNYSDMINSIECHLLISSPTRFFPNCAPSLLDHIYTNIPSKKPKIWGNTQFLIFSKYDWLIIV